MGKLGGIAKLIWTFLDGKKTILWAFVVAAERAFPHLPIWGFVDSAAGAIGWDKIAPAVNPDDLVMWGTLALALGHKLHKAWKDNPVDLKWETIGKVPEVKNLASMEPGPIKVKLPDYEFVEERSKAVVPVGHQVTVADGRSGVVMFTKETSAQGYTYVVRVEKK